MNKEKIKNLCLIVLFISAFITFGVINQYSYALTKEKNDVYSIKITSDGKELKTEETQDIFFKVEENPYVSKGKFAPGCTASAKIEIDLSDDIGDFNIKLNADTNSIPKNIKLYITVDNKEYNLGEEISFSNKEDKIEIKVILIWENEFNNEDMIFMQNNEKLKIPISWEINEKI